MNPCNPHCKDCKDLNPSYPDRVDFDVNQLIMDAEDFLGNVDRVHRLIIMGGDTLLHPELNKLLNFMIHQEKIGLINIFTDGSINPQADILDVAETSQNTGNRQQLSGGCVTQQSLILCHAGKK